MGREPTLCGTWGRAAATLSAASLSAFGESSGSAAGGRACISSALAQLADSSRMAEVTYIHISTTTSEPAAP